MTFGPFCSLTSSRQSLFMSLSLTCCARCYDRQRVGKRVNVWILLCSACWAALAQRKDGRDGADVSGRTSVSGALFRSAVTSCALVPSTWGTPGSRWCYSVPAEEIRWFPDTAGPSGPPDCSPNSARLGTGTGTAPAGGASAALQNPRQALHKCCNCWLTGSGGGQCGREALTRSLKTPGLIRLVIRATW